MAFKTYEEATKWLAKIGGQIRGPSPKYDGYDELIVHLPGHTMTRAGMVDNSLTGAAYEADRKRAVVDACNEFKAAGAERLAMGR